MVVGRWSLVFGLWSVVISLELVPRRAPTVGMFTTGFGGRSSPPTADSASLRSEHMSQTRADGLSIRRQNISLLCSYNYFAALPPHTDQGCCRVPARVLVLMEMKCRAIEQQSCDLFLAKQDPHDILGAA